VSGSVSPTAAWVDATGIHAPTFTDVQDYLISRFQAIYGADIVVSNDSQDGQMIGVFALAISDTNAACIAAYNSYSPTTAQGVGLSTMVKINGMARALPSNSTCDLLLTGQTGTTIINGAAYDQASNLWNLPPTVVIPPSGQITVTATCALAGAVTSAAGTITRIATVTLGWQLVTNPLAAVPGAPVEDDAALRVRQAQSTALPALSVLSGIVGAVLALPGVIACVGYENDTNATDANGLPPHSISLVVEGGDSTQICQTILLKKTPGCYTQGTTRHTVNDVYGLPHDIGYYQPTSIAISVAITLHALPGYSTIVGNGIKQAVADYINNLGSGADVIYSKLWLPANLCDDTSGLPTDATATYDITAMTVGSPPTYPMGTANIPTSIFQQATCDPANVTITVT